MNEQRSSPQPAPGPQCAALVPLLPLLSLGKLDPDEAAPVREHMATCDYCQCELRDFDTLRGVLRRRHVPALNAEPTPSSEPMPVLTLAAVLDAATREGDADDGRAGDVPTPALTAMRPGPIPARGRGRWAGHGAIAAALLIALLAGALFRWHAGPAVWGTLVPGKVVPVPGLGTLTEFSLPQGHIYPGGIYAGSDGNVWFTEDNRNGWIGRITPQGVVTEYQLPAQLAYGLAAAPDGTIWFTGDANKIGRLSPRDGKITEVALPTPNMIPVFIVLGPGGDLWFATGNNLQDNLSPPTAPQTEIGRITPGGAHKEFPLPNAYINGLAAGRDGNLWFYVVGQTSNVHRIGRMSPAGDIKWFSVQLNPFGGCKCDVSVITAGPDGNVWFTSGVPTHDPNIFQGQIGRITPQGNITEFPLPGNPATDLNAQPTAQLTAGPDGNLWFAARDEHTLGRITPKGVITEFALPQGIYFADITLGPDGNLWFPDPVANTIDRLQLNRSG